MRATRSTVLLVSAIALGGCQANDRPGASSDAALRRPTSAARAPAAGAVYDLDGEGDPDLAQLRVYEPRPVGDASTMRWRWQLVASDGAIPLEWELDLPASGPFSAERITRFVVGGDSLTAGRYEDPDGRALLPSLPADCWMPWTFETSRHGWPDSVRLLGRTGRRRGDESPPPPRPLKPEVRVLDPHVLIATSREFRDVGRDADGEWIWKDLDADDYREMIAAGFNLFRVSRSALSNVAEEAVWFHFLDLRWPPLPLHPGFRGSVMYADEPAIRARTEPSFRHLGDSRTVARRIAERTAEMLESEDAYGRHRLASKLRETGAQWGAVGAERVVVWEAVASAAWYQMEAGADAWVHETRLDAAEFAADVRRELDLDFPADADAIIDLHVALFRGAARRFERPWGVAIYGQTGPDVAERLFPLAYDAGATYFWFWTSDRNHHVPRERQLRLARELRSHQAAHPRPEGPAARTATSRIALVLPWGYAFDDWTLMEDPARLWSAPGLPLSKAEDADVPRRDVLRAAMRIALNLIDGPEPWDILFLRADESASGYEEVYRVDRRGRVTRGR